MRAVVALALAACTDRGRGNADVEGTVQLASLSCERTDAMTVVVRGEAAVFMREGRAFRVATTSADVPLELGQVETTIFACGAWQTPTGCVREPGDPSRELVRFVHTAELAGGLPATVFVTVDGFIGLPTTAQVFDEDVAEVICR